MNAIRASTLLGLCLAVATLSGCAYYAPHSLVASNIPTTGEPLTAGGTRVEADVCGSRVLGIPFGPDPRMTAVMDALAAQVTNAVGFEDIRIDVSRVNYLFPFYWQDCVHAAAYPLFGATKAHPPKQARKSGPPAEAPAPPESPTDAAPADSPDPFAK